MTPITDRLSALAAQMREDARQAGIHATEHRPLIEKAAAKVADARRQVEELERQHAEAMAALKEYQRDTEERHALAVATVEQYEKDGQEAADMAAKLDRLAAEHRTAPELPTPDEAVAAAGLVVEQCDECESTGRNCTAHGGRPGIPYRPPADDLPFNVVPAPPQTVAAVEQAAGELVAVHGPGVTAPMPDAPHRHARPKERPGLVERITRRTGPHRVIASPDATRPDTDVPDELLAEGQRQARPDDQKENDR